MMRIRTIARRLLVLLALPGLAWAGPVLRVGEAPAVAPGSSFTVPVFVSGASALTAFQFDLTFDERVLEALGFSDADTDFERAALAAGGVLTGLTGFAGPGLLSGIADSIGGTARGLDGDGVLVYLNFRAIAAGTTDLTLSQAFVDLAPLPDDALVHGSVQVPAPAAWLLLLWAVPLVVPRRPGHPVPNRKAST